MNETKFTPGPWMVKPHTASEYGSLDCCTFAIFEAAQVPYQVATIMGDAGLACHCAANAHLIAAAPEMYAALKDALTVLESIEAKTLVGHEGCIWPAEIVRAALAKAGRGAL